MEAVDSLGRHVHEFVKGRPLHASLPTWHAHPAALQLVEAFGSFFVAFGFKRNVGRCWAVLFLAPEPLDQAALCSRLEVSAGLVSEALKELEGAGAIRSAAVPGSRRIHYRAEPRLLRTVATILLRRDLEAVLALRRAVVAARRDLPQGGGFAASRLALVEDVTRLYELLARWVVRLSRLPDAALGSTVRVLRNTRDLLPGIGRPPTGVLDGP